MAEHNVQFKNIKVGDTVVVSRRNHELAQVTHVTATRFSVGSHSFYKKDGTVYGYADIWSRPRVLRIATQDDHAEHARRAAQNAAATALERAALRARNGHFTLGYSERVLALLKELES